jgi:hypothetical protein
VNNIFVLNKNYKQIGVLSNQGANPQAPYYEDLYMQELDTGADTYQFSTVSTPYTQDLLELGNHIMFTYKNRNELFTITSIEYSHNEGYKTIGVYAEGIGFELLEVYMERPEITENGGNDSDNDGDDNTDDEYGDPDDVYIDADGNIIYIKYDNGEEPSADDVTIDGDGNIIYNPSKNKRNDSLELKNISYPTFLKLLLKDTGWSYTIQPGLESNKQDMSIRYDTNIYAILQDSMQTYKGVELEFVHEYNNGEVKKIVKAYNDGGRGSFIGKRFEYGVNVRGITKTQKVANSEDDTILYIDDVGIEVYYDIDFALKSAEVPEIEIGDTHYVIDKDFYPPMTIKARIGKIEISFSDSTRNKIYLANNKKIRGSVPEDVDENVIKDIIDDHVEPPEDYKDDIDDLKDKIDSLTPGGGGGSSGGDDSGGNTGGSSNPNTGWWDGTGSPGTATGQILGQYNIGGPLDASEYPNSFFYEDCVKNFNNSPRNPLLSVDGDVVVGNIHGIRGFHGTFYGNTWPQSDISLKENIRYIDNTDTSTVNKENLNTRDYSKEELLVNNDLYDFIVNQVNLCEYNFIGSNMQKIGFIANEYEGIKVGNKIVIRDKETDLLYYDSNNLLFATIGALQEEVRIKDEQIASLEDRLARIEAMLGITNNDN